jgi:hypothetical protein
MMKKHQAKIGWIPVCGQCGMITQTAAFENERDLVTCKKCLAILSKKGYEKAIKERKLKKVV